MSKPPPNRVHLYILSTRQQLTVPLDKTIILGRLPDGDHADGHYIDLTNHFGHQLGVSRRHLMLTLSENEVMAFDLSSHNGSFINEERMSADTGYIVNDGDEIKLGSLCIRVYNTDNIPYKKQTQPFRSTSLAYPDPSIRETLETRPLRAYEEVNGTASND
ncbi:MAG: FHA domain-containing protein [Anaerolineales bacterium]|nr:FHA domain-containing protein [Anaerolineales bacterium]